MVLNTFCTALYFLSVLAHNADEALGAPAKNRLVAFLLHKNADLLSIVVTFCTVS